jgi:hypothetical protein
MLALLFAGQDTREERLCIWSSVTGDSKGLIFWDNFRIF